MNTTTETKHPTDTLLDHSWIHTDQANEYLKAISRTDHQLKDFCKSAILICLFSLLLHPRFSSTAIESNSSGWTHNKIWAI